MGENVVEKSKDPVRLTESTRWERSYPYEDVIGHALALVPLVQNELNFEDRVFITKLRSQLIEQL